MNISMNVSVSTAAAGTNAAGGAHGHGDRRNMQAVMEPVAKALGMSTDELRSATKSGQSLNDIAKAKGVSHEDLIAAIQSGLKSAQDASGAAAPQGQDLSAVAERIAGRAGGKGPGGGGGHHDHDGDGPKGAPPATAAATSLSTALGMSTTELFKQLDSGTDLYDLAQTKGVGAKALNDLLSAGLRVDQQL